MGTALMRELLAWRSSSKGMSMLKAPYAVLLVLGLVPSAMLLCKLV